MYLFVIYNYMYYIHIPIICKYRFYFHAISKFWYISLQIEFYKCKFL